MRATRITYVGELGWELYVPTEFAVGVYEDLVDAGADLGLTDAGYYAINSLRLDKGYRAFGSDLTPDHTPVEAGLRFTCKLKTADRLHRPRRPSSRAIAEGPRRRLVSLRLEDPDLMLWGGELVLRDGEPAGQVTSAAWSATSGRRRAGLRLAAGPGAGHRRGPGRRARTRSTWGVDSNRPPSGSRAFFDPSNERIRS